MKTVIVSELQTKHSSVNLFSVLIASVDFPTNKMTLEFKFDSIMLSFVELQYGFAWYEFVSTLRMSTCFTHAII